MSIDPNAANRTDAEWREILSPEEYRVLRQAGTERPGTGELLHENRDGLYRCAACKAELFLAGTKFDSGCGWPSFYEVVRPDAVKLLEDNSLARTRVEVRCANCDSHLGHVFPDGFGTPTGDRYCMNSVALNFEAGASAEGPVEQTGESVFSAHNRDCTCENHAPGAEKAY